MRKQHWIIGHKGNGGEDASTGWSIVEHSLPEKW